MSSVHLRSLEVPRIQEEDRPRLFRNRAAWSGNHGGWKNTQGNHSHTTIHLSIQQEPQIRGLEEYVSRSSDPLTPQRLFLMEHRQQ
ncbi:hypothetical protein O181_120156 [Austropuccinia psidii MF-1]|uniref:Uncharacterized protein n=1 Tax=Austropuccinia psidii MF-1 TaxID=1389203 RepID=A0A9Q3KH47_9BASI|nr:hypothetical protein [Austropuccinia psidii MF-1]